MSSSWRKLVDFAERVADNLSSIQGVYKKQLIWDIREFGIDIRGFRKEFEDGGPMVAGISPAVGVERMKKFKEEIKERERKMEIYRAGEELFALRPTKFNELMKTRKEINLMDNMIKKNTIHHGDCLEIMKNIEDESISMILADLPYGSTKAAFDS
jgi:dynein heavy chain